MAARPTKYAVGCSLGDQILQHCSNPSASQIDCYHSQLDAEFAIAKLIQYLEPVVTLIEQLTSFDLCWMRCLQPHHCQSAINPSPDDFVVSVGSAIKSMVRAC